MKIIGTGSAHPKCAVTNEMLEKFLETTDEWITERTGIKERLVISSEPQGPPPPPISGAVC